jgi:asparagine synthase (glutamine-hydrolysing)
VENASVSVRKYWDVRFEPSRSGDIKRFRNDMRGEIEDSVDKHLRADVPVGSHLSGGIDSTLVATLASRQLGRGIEAFHGKFTDFPGYDESQHATAAARHAGMALRQIDIQAEDFIDTIADVVYHLDQPTAGPGSFPQYMVSQLAAEHVKVVLGGQGGDEIFAGYARYLIAYFEQAFKAEMNGGVYGNGFTVKLAALIPNLQVLADYKPLLSMFFSEGLFGDIDQRYFRLVDRFSDLKREVAPDIVDRDYAFELFQSIFNDTEHVCSDVFLDRMTYFDLKTLLPALLQVEDRVSMAHGLESRTPLVDHRIIEFCAQVPAAVRFQDGRLKGLLRDASASALPRATLERPDKMGFPVPLSEWMSGKLGPFIRDLFSARPARERAIFDADAVIGSMTEAAKFSRKHWGLLCLELWHQAFLDRRAEFKVMHVRMAEDPAVTLHDDARGHLREISAPPPRKRKPRSHDAMPTDRSTASTSDGERLQ